MAILLISMDFPPHKDGITTIAGELAKGLAAGQEPFYVLGPKSKGDKDFDRSLKCKVYRSPFYSFGRLRFFPLVFMVPYIIWRHKINKIVATSVGYGGIIAYILKGMFNCEYVVTAQGYEFLKYAGSDYVKNLFVRVYNHSKAVVACSLYVKNILINYGVQPGKVRVIYPGVNLSVFRERPPEKGFTQKYGLAGKKIILTVARLVERKGQDLVIKSLKRVIHEIPDALYVIVGTGPAEEMLRNLAAKNGVADFIRFTGEVSGDELIQFYNVCDLFIMPSREILGNGHVEGFGIVYLEANACGKPVIGGRSGGVVEAIIEGETGLLVSPDSADNAAENIIKILKDSRFAKMLGNNGLKRVQREFTWNNYIDKFSNALGVKI